MVEISIVVTIIALLMATIFRWSSIAAQRRGSRNHRNGERPQRRCSGLQAAFPLLAGDFPVDAANPEIQNVSAACRVGGSGAGNGNGQISSDESACAAEHLIRAGMVRGDPATGFVTRFGAVRLIITNDATAKVTSFPASVLNIVEMANIPCDEAMDIARKLDAGELQTGTGVRASIASCTSGNVPFLGFAL